MFSFFLCWGALLIFWASVSVILILAVVSFCPFATVVAQRSLFSFLSFNHFPPRPHLPLPLLPCRLRSVFCFLVFLCFAGAAFAMDSFKSLSCSCPCCSCILLLFQGSLSFFHFCVCLSDPFLAFFRVSFQLVHVHRSRATVCRVCVCVCVCVRSFAHYVFHVHLQLCEMFVVSQPLGGFLKCLELSPVLLVTAMCVLPKDKWSTAEVQVPEALESRYSTSSCSRVSSMWGTLGAPCSESFRYSRSDFSIFSKTLAPVRDPNWIQQGRNRI